MSEKIKIPVTTLVYCKQQLDAGASESCPEEMQDCLSLLRSGAIKVHIVPPNRTGAKTWNTNREAHVLDYKTSPKDWRHVHSMYLVNQAFLKKSARLLAKLSSQARKSMGKCATTDSGRL